MKKIVSIVIGIIIVILGIVLISNNDSEVIINEGENSTEESMERLSVQHKYDNGKHTLHGVIAAPTPCHKVDITSENDGDDTVVDITLTEGEDVCTQVITNQPFFYSFEAEEGANILATYNGQPIELNILTVEEGDSFDMADFMFKG